MTSVKIGELSPFPPLPGQPYPPARNHPRWKEICRLHDEWILKYWPFSSEKKRARFPFMLMPAFCTWGAPAADFDRMVWVARWIGTCTLADDYIDSGKMLDRIPGFKKTATGTGALHPEDRAELCHDITYRAIKATCHPRTFDQITKCTNEWWDSHYEPFSNLDQYLAMRRINIGTYMVNSFLRYAYNINLTDEQVYHPLMREADGIISDQIGIVNDCFSYGREKLTNSDDTNIIRILQDKEGLSYDQAIKYAEKLARQKEQDFIPAGLAVLQHPDLGKDPEVKRWISCLPYGMGGNIAWSHKTGRYNFGDVPGGVPCPKMSFEIEPTPEADIVDDSEESRIHAEIFDIKNVPEPQNTVDIDPIESGTQKIDTKSRLIVSNFLEIPQPSRPQNIGITAIEACPRRLISSIRQGEGHGNKNHGDDGKDLSSQSVMEAVSSLLSKYSMGPEQIGRVEIYTAATASCNSKAVTASILNIFRSAGNTDVEATVSANSSYDSVTAFVNAVNWIESSAWDGRYVLLVVENDETHVVALIGADAPIVLEPYRGHSLEPSEPSPSKPAVDLVSRGTR